MNTNQIKILEELNIILNNNKSKLFEKFVRIFLKKNSHLNLISQNDEKKLFEKHIFDSLAINLLPLPLAGEGLGVRGHFQQNQTLLDIGTGGGFPAIPIAILYENLKVYPLDSIRKKINAIEEIKEELGLKNLFPICDRVENIKEEYDYITSRAVAPLDKILKYSEPRIKKGGYFIAYKSKKGIDELKEAQNTIKKSGIKLVEIIEYKLPLEETFERNLIVFQK